MNDNQARTISTVAIWVATAIIFTFGVCRMSWSGAVGGMFWALMALALAIAPAAATHAIWTRSSTDNSTKPPSPTPPPTQPGKDV